MSPELSDPPEHDRLRRVLKQPLAASELRSLENDLADEAEALVDRLVARRTFDAVADFARYLPLLILSRFVGLPQEWSERMLDWAQAAFNTCGPFDKQRTLEAFPIAVEQMSYLMAHAVPGKLKPGCWGRGFMRPRLGASWRPKSARF